MIALNFPHYSFRFKSSENKTYIFDIVRKKFVVLQPEEWVRQHVVHYLIQEKKYPHSLVQVEKQLTINALKKRYDVVVFKPNGDILLIVECKAPSVEIKQETFDQIARYNLALGPQTLMVTNGLRHFFCRMDYEAENYQFLPELPDYR